MTQDDLIFNEALEFHRRGELAVASRKYKKLIKRVPDHVDALHHLGMILKAEGQLDNAEKLFRRCIEIDPNFPAIYNSLGALLGERGDFEGALACGDEALRLMPSNQNANLLVARSYNELGQTDAALAAYSRALFFNPNSYQALNNSGNIYLSRGELDLALTLFDKAIICDPSFELAYFNRAMVLIRRKNYGAALLDLQRLVRLWPNNAIYWVNLSQLYGMLLSYSEAIHAAEKACDLNPANSEALFALASANLDSGNIVKAQQLFTQILEDNSENLLAWLGYGITLKEQSDLSGASEAFERAKLDPANVYDAEFNQACIQLLQGNLLIGFEKFEARKKQSNPFGFRAYGVPEWLGHEDLTGKTILVHEEQGIGDTILFMRYLPLLSELGANIIFAVEPKLRRLLRCSPFTFSLIDPKLPDVPFDYHCALMSLPHAFKTTLDNVPSQIPYLHPELERQDYWLTKLQDKGFKIGICWQGSRSKIDQGRSIPLSEFYRLAIFNNVSLLSLQKGYGEEQLSDIPAGINIFDLGNEFDATSDAFIDAAAVIVNCDLVITSDTAIAHLAGALGIKTWVALRSVPDWRWMLERTDSPWYPTMKLFRQSVAGDWTSVFEDMVNELRQLLNDN